ncbi:hypothetical protein TNCV_4913551 [Trichonephila clavipes]|nr:hypothetical protein TNCV_4913551 [Trichonephila clavipes]
MSMVVIRLVSYSVFNDESRFTLGADDHLLRVWGQRSHSAFVSRRHTDITSDVTMWGDISYDRRPSLVILHASLKAQ